MEDVESLSRKEACSFTVHDTGLRHMRATPYSGLAMAAAVAASIENVLKNPPTSSLLLAGFSFLSAALPAGALPAAGAAFFCRGARYAGVSTPRKTLTRFLSVHAAG